MKKQTRRTLFQIILVLGLIAAAAWVSFRARQDSIWPAARTSVDSGYHMVMGTFARVVVVLEPDTAEKAIQAALTELENVDNLMSDYKEDSELSRLNRDACKQAIKVSEPTLEVLQRAVEFSKLTDGAFDVTVGPLVDLWRSAAHANHLPTQADLETARAKVGYEKLILDANNMTVRFAVEGMRLDLGGIAKGYAIDKAVEAIRNCGAIGAMVDVGGDIRCFGAAPPGKDTWRIGLQDPSKTKDWLGTGKPLLVLKLVDSAIATSGDYRRFALIEGQKHSHVMDQDTGQTSDELSSVTIIAQSALQADALATAATVLGPEKALTLIENLPDTEAILISPAPDFQITKTTGADKYIK
jgi:thiamine biosynthesis lipoprotein